MRPCEDIDAIDRAKVEAVWPDFVPVDYVSGGACDGSGDPLGLNSDDTLSDDEVDTIVTFLDDEGWTYNAKDSDATYRVWTRTVDGNDFEADVWKGQDGQVFVIYRD